MIIAVRANNPKFKTVDLKSGFNVIVAERTEESSQKDSRNGSGKTTLIEIIHFCLGSTQKKNRGLLHPKLKGWEFYLDIKLGGNQYTISRTTSEPNQVKFVDGDWSEWPHQPMKTLLPEATLSINEWKEVLGWLMFSLPLTSDDHKYTPTFRSLISYFVRRGKDAFTIPFEHYRKQKVWQKQVDNAFLLNLNWEHAQAWQLLKDRQKEVNQLVKVIRTGSGVISKLVGTIGELETERVRLQDHIDKVQDGLDSFQVHPQYKEIEGQSNRLTKEIHKLSNANKRERQILDLYQDNTLTEQSATQNDIYEMYREMGIELPDNVIKRLEDVKLFHEELTNNRRNYLQNEIVRLTHMIAERETKIQELSRERADLLDILQTHGALAEYTKLQQRQTQSVAELKDINLRISRIREFEKAKSDLKIENEMLISSASNDYQDRFSIRQKAISYFDANSESLYNAPGSLIINVTKMGFNFDVDIERSTSQGIEQMKVFCYDLMLAQLWAEKPVSPGFLIHDSTLFDGVDERQIALALQLAEKEAESKEFQYLCLLNSDMIPYQDFEQDFNISDYVRLELTDETDEGGLLGFRF